MAATRPWIRCDSAVAIVREARTVSRPAPHSCSTLHDLRLDGYENKPVRPLILRQKVAIGLFLTLNRCRLKAGKAAAVKTMLAVAAGTLDERGLAAWIQAHIEPA